VNRTFHRFINGRARRTPILHIHMFDWVVDKVPKTVFVWLRS
jgi:hypothetical protein